jgi:hypothetical protein
VSIIKDEAWGRRLETKVEGVKKVYNDNKKSKFLAKRTGISPPPTPSEPHLHINSVLAVGSGRAFCAPNGPYYGDAASASGGGRNRLTAEESSTTTLLA